MENTSRLSRRTVIRSSFLGLISVSIPSIVFSREIREVTDSAPAPGKLFHRYPSIDDEIVAEVVGASHFNLDRVKELVTHRPELARATWDWSFGDWESALGASSHVGRRDIAEFLMLHGARPNIFTYTMLGHYDAVKAMIEATPGVESIGGPHGISLLQHAKTGLRMKETMTQQQVTDAERLVAYLETLEGADGVTYLEMNDDQEKYLGDYKYGDGEEEGLSIKLNMRNLISLGKLGKFGGALYKIGDNRFTYNGAPSVEITFQFEKDKVISLTIHEPDLILKAKKV